VEGIKGDKGGFECIGDFEAFEKMEARDIQMALMMHQTYLANFERGAKLLARELEAKRHPTHALLAFAENYRVDRVGPYAAEDGEKVWVAEVEVAKNHLFVLQLKLDFKRVMYRFILKRRAE